MSRFVRRAGIILASVALSGIIVHFAVKSRSSKHDFSAGKALHQKAETEAQAVSGNSPPTHLDGASVAHPSPAEVWHVQRRPTNTPVVRPSVPAAHEDPPLSDVPGAVGRISMSESLRRAIDRTGIQMR